MWAGWLAGIFEFSHSDGLILGFCGLLLDPGHTQWLTEIIVNHLFATLGCFAADDFSFTSLSRSASVQCGNDIGERRARGAIGGAGFKQRCSGRYIRFVVGALALAELCDSATAREKRSGLSRQSLS